jgi:hypothetical protein
MDFSLTPFSPVSQETPSSKEAAMSGTVLLCSSAQWTVSPRLCALKRILPKADLASALQRTGNHATFCSVIPGWLVVWFVVAMGNYRSTNFS